jgi:hypothetical protein
MVLQARMFSIKTQQRFSLLGCAEADIKLSPPQSMFWVTPVFGTLLSVTLITPLTHMK